MFVETNLVKTSIYTDRIPKDILEIDYSLIKKKSMDSFNKNLKLNQSDWVYLYNYYHYDHDINITKLNDYITSHMKLLLDKKSLILLRGSTIIQDKGKTIESHQHIDDYNIDHSPDYSVIFVVDHGQKANYVEFEFEGGRQRHMKRRIFLQKSNILLFNSELKHSFSINENEEKNIFLSLKYQII